MGPLRAAVGAQFDHEQLDTDYDDYYDAPSNTDYSRHSYAVFTEERLPLLAGSGYAGSPEVLALSAAGRYDKFSDFEGKATGQGGLEWRPLNGLLFRAAYATSYKAPQLYQLSGGASAFTESYQDPFRGSYSSSTTETTGPNPNLQPETGRSRVFGVVYDSPDHPGLSASLNYFAIDLSNYIAIPNTQVLIDNPALFPGAITRAAPSAADQQSGYPGAITHISDLYYNYGDIRVAGLDFAAKDRFESAVGNFIPSIAVTDMMRYRAALTPGSADISYLSAATINGPGFTPRWKGTAALTWERGPVSSMVTGRYIGPYLDYQDYVANDNRLGNTWYTDINVRLDLGKAFGITDRWYGQASAEFGAVNVLNTLPRFSYNYNQFDYSEADLRGRFIYAQLHLKL